MVPLSIAIFMLFAPFEFGSETTATIYYVVIAMLFWTLYTTYVIPYMSLGAELASDYNGRNYIRMFNMIFGGLFMLLCTSGPTMVQTWGTAHGLTDRDAWGLSGAIFAAIALLCGIISHTLLRGKETDLIKNVSVEKGDNIFKTIKETLSIRPYRRLCIMTFLVFIGYVLSSSASVYLINYNCAMSGGQQAVFWIVYAVAYTAMVPFGSAIANKFGKKQSFISGTFITVILCVILFVLNIWNFAMAIVLVIIYQLGSTVLWTNYLAFAYDCAEVDEYKNGKRREGSLCAIVSFAQKLGSAIGTYSIGIVLTLTGYDAMALEQTAGALRGISGCSTLGVAVSGVIGILLMMKYPIGKKEYDLILQANEDKKAGKAVDETAFRHCL